MSVQSITPVHCPPLQTNSFLVPTGAIVPGACHVSTVALSTCVQFDTVLFSTYALNTSSTAQSPASNGFYTNTSAIITTSDIDFSDCVSTSLCSDTQSCRIYNANRTRTLMCLERVSVGSSLDIRFFDYTATSNLINIAASEMNNVTRPSNRSAVCLTTQSDSTYFNCQASNNLCTLSPALSNTSTLINSTTLINTPPPSTALSTGADLSIGTIFIYLLVPFIFAAVLIPCVVLRLRRFTLRKPKPVITKAKPVEIVYVDRRDLEEELSMNRLLQEQQNSTRHRQSLDSSNMETSGGNRPTALDDEKRRWMGMPQTAQNDTTAILPSSASSSTCATTAHGSMSIHIVEEALDTPGNTTVAACSSAPVSAVVVDMSTAHAASPVQSEVGRGLLPASTTDATYANQILPMGQLQRINVSPPTSTSHVRLSMPLGSSSRPQLLTRPFHPSVSHEDIRSPLYSPRFASPSSLLRQAQGSQSARDISETTAIIYSGHPPEYEEALTDSVNRPGDRYDH